MRISDWSSDVCSSDLKAPLQENLTLTVEQSTALPKPNDYRDYEVGQRIILIDLPYLGATVREVLPHCVGIDYDNDGPDKGSHEAVYSRIRPKPPHRVPEAAWLGERTEEHTSELQSQMPT